MFIIMCMILYMLSKINRNVNDLVCLQNCMDVLQSDHAPCTGTFQISSNNGYQVVGIKVEDATDIKVEEDPDPATSSLIKTESAVSCLCVCIQCYSGSTDIQNSLPIGVFSVCIKLGNVDQIG